MKRYIDKKHSHLSIGPVLFVPWFDPTTERWGSAFETDDPKLQAVIERSAAFGGLAVEECPDKAAAPPTRAELGRMNKKELQKLLVGLGALVPEEATKAKLVDLIVDFKAPGEEE